MILSFKIKSAKYKIDTGKPLKISIPLDFHGNQPNAFGVPAASAEAVKTNEFIGDTKSGGSCNFEKYEFITHCVGTHTECAGHITNEKISINETLQEMFIPCTLISVAAVKAEETNENIGAGKEPEDFLITKDSLRKALSPHNENFIEGLIVRTLPNDDTKKTRDYMKVAPPFFTAQAMEYIVSLKVNHLLTDLPSLDRTFDKGLLSAHRIFWGVPPKTHEIKKNSVAHKTITEMIYVSNNIKNGNYILNLQIPDFIADAAPSRPVLFEPLFDTN